MSSAVQDALQIPSIIGRGDIIRNEHASNIRANLRDLLIQGELLYHFYTTRAVIRIMPDTVIKLNQPKIILRYICFITSTNTRKIFQRQYLLA